MKTVLLTSESDVEIVERIHRAFKESFDSTEAEFTSMLNKLEMQLATVSSAAAEQMDYAFIKDLFPQAPQVKKLKEALEDHQKTRTQHDDVSLFLKEIDTLRVKFPHLRMITYSQMVSILEQYNLFVGPSSMYVGEIPKKNAKEIYNFSMQYGVTSTYHCDTSFAYVNSEIPLCSKGFNKTSSGKRQNGLYIVGKFKDFAHENLSCVGREIFIDKDSPTFKLENRPAPPDPIVLAPLQFTSEIGNLMKVFLVVSAWGAEAKEVVNPQSN